MNQYLAQYHQQMTRLRRIQREAEKRGYIFPKSPLPRAVKNPTSKTIERLSSITPTKLRSKGYKTSPETGELVRQTPRRQEAEREAQALARSMEHIRTALERYAKQREERRLAQRQADELRQKQLQVTERSINSDRNYDRVLRANHPQEILDIFGVTSPEELPQYSAERYALLYSYDIENEPEYANVPEPPITWEEYQDIARKKEERQREKQRKIPVESEQFPKGEGPLPYKDLAIRDVEQLLREIDYGRNPEVADFLKQAIEDELMSLEMEYGEGTGAEILSERIANTDENLLDAAKTTTQSYTGEELQASAMKILTVIRGTPSSSEKATLEKLVFEATKGTEISRNKRGYFRR